MKVNVKDKIFSSAKSLRETIKIFTKWLFISLLVGVCGGAVGTVFHKGIELATELRIQHSFLLWLMPVGGLLIVFLYHICKLPKDPGTNLVLTSARLEKDGVPLRMLPLIFTATIISQLTGASAGREGAALQIGGAISTLLSKIFKLTDKSRPIILVCGMSAVFAALFGTPLAATVFSLEVISVGMMHYSALFPALVSAFTAAGISKFFGCEPVRFTLETVPTATAVTFLKCSLLGIVCAVMSILFCCVLKRVKKKLCAYIKNDYIRVLVGGIAVVALSLVFSSGRYNGSGFDIVTDIFNGGEAYYQDAFLKIIFTAICLGVGFKGGEIVPTMFVGAVTGYCVGALIGINPIFAAAVGMTAMFCGMTNTPLASLILSVEVFSGVGLPLFAIAIFLSYALSGNYSLYTGQRLIFSKFFAQKIDIQAK